MAGKQVCWICGSEETKPHMQQVGDRFTHVAVEAKHQERWRHFCAECKAKENERLKAAQQTLAKARKEIMFERAQQILEGQRFDMYAYREAIDAVGAFIAERPDDLDSAYEMVAAIVLIHNRVRCKPQQKIGRYRVDFLLPDEYVVLEIDGYHHQNTACRDSQRDIEIRRELGPEWEIVRIATKYLDRNAAKLVDAIHEVVEQRIFGGQKPAGDKFAKLEKALYG